MKKKNKNPPQFFLQFFRWYCHPKMVDYIEGDLMEAYEKRLRKSSKWKADIRFIVDVMVLFRPGIIRPREGYKNLNTYGMLKNYIKIGWRNMRRNTAYSFINIFGLALGMACCLFIFNYTAFELSFDNFHPNLERLYRVDQRLQNGFLGSTGPPMAATLLSNYPEVEAAMRINTPGESIMRLPEGDNTLAFNEQSVFAADSNFFSFFGVRLKEGNAKTALQGPNKVVISDEIARKFFGDKPALGKFLLMGDARTALEITGVTESQPLNTHFRFDYLLSMETNPNVKRRDWSWVWTQVVTYIRLRPGADPIALENKMIQLGEKVIKPALEARGMNYENTLKLREGWIFSLRSMSEIYLKSGTNRVGPVGDYKYVIAFTGIGIFILVIAAINFVNLSTAQGAKRAKEVGVKKAVGVMRSSLMAQFQAESILLCIMAAVVSIPLTQLITMVIKSMADVETPFVLLNHKEWLWIFPLVPVAIGLVAGLYPSVYLTSFRPAQVLKGKVESGRGNLQFRNVLVSVQFVISIALIAGTLIVFQQLQFMSSKDLGFDKENVLLIQNAEKLGAQLESFRQEINNYSGVINTGMASVIPGAGRWGDDFTRENSEAIVNAGVVKADEQYLKALNFEIVAGRTFDVTRPSDKNAAIPIESTVRALGWTPQNAIGQYLVYPGDNLRFEIIGVVKDFHNESLRQAYRPIIFFGINSDVFTNARTIAIKFAQAEIGNLLPQVEKKWKQMLDDTPFMFSFLDEDLANQYQTEQRLGRLFGIFSALSIMIGLIGLVGLVSYSAELRKKEIGIRKVFGASSASITLMMNSQYVRLLLFSLVLAVPLAWWGMANWLESFQYRIEINPFTFALAGLAELIIALLSVGYLSIRAAMMNPSKSLREE